MIDFETEDLYDRYESQYSRTADGELIPIVKPTLEDLETTVEIVIDGVMKKVPRAVPCRNEQGSLVLNEDGELVPRPTTILDAAKIMFKDSDAWRRKILVLCHQDHVTPVGVCRVCCVMTVRDGKVSDRLFPACQHPVYIPGDARTKGDASAEKPMIVHSRESREELTLSGGRKLLAGKYVYDQVKVLVDLLAINHLHHDQPKDDEKYKNELLEFAKIYGLRPTVKADLRIELPGSRFHRPTRKKTSPSALAPKGTKAALDVITYDPNNCILCDRCVRGCSETKPFKIIGHTGFGNRAVVSFDLGKAMRDSECVSCGECAVSCPTGALTFQRGVYGPFLPPDLMRTSVALPDLSIYQDPWKDEQLPKTPDRMTHGKWRRIENKKIRELFDAVPLAFRKWNEGAVGWLELSEKDGPLCREGQFGSIAFLIEKGTVQVVLGTGTVVATLTPESMIVGEMACLSHQVRNATLKAGPGGATVLVIKRNLLYMLQRNAKARDVLAPIYARRALDTMLRRGGLFKDLDKTQSQICIDFLKKLQDEWEDQEKENKKVNKNDRPLSYLQYKKDQKIVRDGTDANHYFIIYRGHVSISGTAVAGQALVRDYLGPQDHFGEIGLLSDPAISARVANELPPSIWGKRTSNCIALDHVEVVRITKDALLKLFNAVPAIKAPLEDRALYLLGKNKVIDRTVGMQLEPFTRPGLYQGRKLLVLDLTRCTRCQECVKACAEAHDGVTRVLLDGDRYGNYLVPSACRSCYDPECLVGCPVDAIHRRPSTNKTPQLAIVIENHCIGCGLCAHNCPYGSIHMTERAPGQRQANPSKNVATNCNLCEDKQQGFTPQCEKRCPHDAAMHMEALEFAKLVGLNPSATGRE